MTAIEHGHAIAGRLRAEACLADRPGQMARLEAEADAVDALVAEVERLRAAMADMDGIYAARLNATLTGSASPDETTWPGYWEAKRLVLAELDRKPSVASEGERK